MDFNGRQRTTNNGLFLFVMIFVSLFAADLYAENAEDQGDILLLLPQISDLKDWKAEGDPQKAVGEDLFVLINGGAELFLKCGFRQAVLLTYQNKKGKRINLELFEMKNAAAASEIYGHKSGGEGKKLSVGDEALLAEYYLIFRKGRFYAALTGFDSEDDTVEGLLVIARGIEKQLSKNGG